MIYCHHLQQKKKNSGRLTTSHVTHNAMTRLKPWIENGYIDTMHAWIQTNSKNTHLNTTHINIYLQNILRIHTEIQRSVYKALCVSGMKQIAVKIGKWCESVLSDCRSTEDENNYKGSIECLCVRHVRVSVSKCPSMWGLSSKCQAVMFCVSRKSFVCISN